ncbi:ABC transporter permease subunit [Acetivibrio mesophilus]|uniref:ABC transporter permease n=1 Tax=Acetivibrio mesophilus TaxID=2487273 RepID=A0A4Q0I8Y3_9FIRM|nr:ABC transporter permease subunit [Acetivibrio mesophilus]ODM27503.1 ABC transporter permease [Clostridium sp. Bc-iso-3]RXE59462.1 ABC transporter permease [Acetivibrio mesophilus]HHV30253.1 ABC transporter permease subunit [Clostridium sp.]
MLSVYKKELRTYFYSPLAYVLSGIFVLVFGIYFLTQTMSKAGQGIAQIVFGGQLFFASFWLVMLIPILTMRVFAEERKNGTEVLLMTSPISVPQIVIGKFLAAFTVFLTMTALTAIFPIIISISGDLVISNTLSSYLGFVLLGASFVAFGLFTSSITESQIIAAVLGTVTLFFILLIDQLKTLVSGIFLKIINQLSLYEHYKQFVQSVISLKDIVFFVSLTGMFLVLVMIVIEKRRWSQG